jgi:kumamolisin
LIGPADPKDSVSFTIVLRRCKDGPPLPDYDYWLKTPAGLRKNYAVDEFAKLYGASPEDLKAVEKFVSDAGMKVVDSSAARRTVQVEGKVSLVNAAFGVVLQRYSSPMPPPRSERPPAKMEKTIKRVPARARQEHRGYEGDLYVPGNLCQIIVGVVGLDNRKVTGRNASASPFFSKVTAPKVCQLYGWPIGPVPGQTVGILSAGSFDPNDVALYYENLNLSLYDTGIQGEFSTGFFVQGNVDNGSPQTVPAGAVAGALDAPSVAAGTLVVAFGTNPGGSDGEANMDISLASTVAQGATIAMYMFDGTTMGWINALGAAVHPAAGKPVPTVLSSSYYICGGDDPTGMAEWGHIATDLTIISAAFHDAAMMNLTVCIASGDSGSDSKVNDGYAHVQYPASDPWVLSCGGTSLGNVNSPTFLEWIWNDYGATGGGVSAFFPRPSYQGTANIPYSLNPTNAFSSPISYSGRGVPDVAANSSPFSSYPIYANGEWEPGAGTSAAAPLIAGVIAQANASIGHNVGFLNPLLYSTNGMACRRILGGSPLGNSFTPPPSPADNSYNGVTGYRAYGTGWNPCTGWGVFDWNHLIHVLTKIKEKDKEKDIKDKEFDKVHIKEEYDVKLIYEYVPIPDPGDPWERFQAQLGVQTVAQLGVISKEVTQLGREMRDLRTFIRPEERPLSGGQSSNPAEDQLKSPRARTRTRGKRKRKG